MLHYRIHKRMYYVYFTVLITFLVIILRVFYLQVFKVNNIKDKADSLWSRNLTILIDNLTTTSLVVILVQIHNKEVMHYKRNIKRRFTVSGTPLV